MTDPGPTTQPTRLRLDVQLGGELSDATARANELAEAGVDGLFTYEGPRDVFYPLVPAAIATELDLYTNIAVALPRSPMHLAYQAYDLQRLAGGRFALGLGTQIRPHIERRYSAQWDKPVSQLREIIQATRAIFASWATDEPLNFEGDYYRLNLMTPMFNPGPLPNGPPPIWAGALGPKMLRMVATHADGLLTHPFTSASFFRSHVLSGVDDGLRSSGRSPDQFVLGVGAIVATGRNNEEIARADRACRSLLGFYGSTPAYRLVLEHHGWGDLQAELRTLTKTGRWGDLADVWDDTMTDTIIIRGTPEEAARELTERFGERADRIALSTPYDLHPSALVDLAAALAGSGR